ncbi:unnamed protein product [Caenorhabditis bovis]|uniref:Cytochrome P450 n=1 Tax=Caenorhabditis bovis TaxID=2654633 RepID=A0A8S1ERB1_9PELO|nr:unnamed protein product [Caenorhabditis bovis]
MILIIVVICVIIALTIGYFKWKHSYWSRRGIEGPPPSLFLGNFYDVCSRDNPRHQVIYEWSKKYGKTFGYYEGVNKVLVTSDLEILNEMFIKKFSDFYARKLTNIIHGNMECPKEEPQVNIFTAQGNRWKRLRSLASPAFSVKAMKQIHSIVEDSVLNMVQLMSKHSDDSSFNIHEYFQELTFDIISRLAIGQTHSEMFNNPGTELAIKIFGKSFRVLPWYLAVMFPQFQFKIKQLFYNHNNVRGGDIGRLVAFCKESVLKRIQKRRENEANGIENEQDDFIDMFLEHHVDEVHDLAFGTAVDRKATTEDVIGYCMIFLLAGFDTTANTMGYVSYLLAKHPDVLKKVQQEVDEVCENANISFDDINKLNYLEAVIKETLRLYPVAYFACSREAVNDTILGKIKIDKGTFIEANVMALHRDPEVWGENAEEFHPERFLEKLENPRHVISWIPFGAGPRQCIGMRLGLTEAKLGLAHLLRKYDIVKSVDTEEDLVLHGCTTTSPEKVTVQIRFRY